MCRGGHQSRYCFGMNCPIVAKIASFSGVVKIMVLKGKRKKDVSNIGLQAPISILIIQ